MKRCSRGIGLLAVAAALLVAGNAAAAGKVAKLEAPALAQAIDRHIQAKIEASPFRQSGSLPAGFDPLIYALSYPDLFELEVDPYEHFLIHGRHESRGH